MSLCPIFPPNILAQNLSVLHSHRVAPCVCLQTQALDRAPHRWAKCQLQAVTQSAFNVNS